MLMSNNQWVSNPSIPAWHCPNSSRQKNSGPITRYLMSPMMIWIQSWSLTNIKISLPTNPGRGIFLLIHTGVKGNSKFQTKGIAPLCPFKLWIGGIQSVKKTRRSRCIWRETSLMQQLFNSAVNRALGLQQSVENWAQISMDLRERPRKRTLQTENLGAKLYPSRHY